MDRMFSDRIGAGGWTEPAAALVGFRSVSFVVKVNSLRPVFAGKLVARATSTCQVLRGEAARGR